MSYGVVLEFANLAKSTLAGAITNVATSANLSSGTGALFPTPTSGFGYVGTFIDAATGLLNEIVLVTQMSGDEIAVMIRAQENTTALGWNAGDFFYMFNTAGTMQALLQQQQAAPARVVTSSASFTCANTDGSIGLARVSGVAAMNITLPVSPTNGQEIAIEDLIGNFNADPVTVIPNAGQNIAGLSGNAVLNVNRQCGYFKFYSTDDTWSFKT